MGMGVICMDVWSQPVTRGVQKRVAVSGHGFWLIFINSITVHRLLKNFVERSNGVEISCKVNVSHLNGV